MTEPEDTQTADDVEPSELTLALSEDGETVTITHGGQGPARAAVLGGDGVVTALVLVPADWEDQDPATRYQPDGEVVVLEGHQQPVIGGWWDHDRGWLAPDPAPDPEPEAPSGEAALRRDVDLLLQLVLTSQDGEANDVASLAPTLRGMAQRTSLTTAVVDGAFGWGVITSDQRAELLDVALPPSAEAEPGDGPVEVDDLDGDEPEQDQAT